MTYSAVDKHAKKINIALYQSWWSSASKTPLTSVEEPWHLTLFQDTLGCNFPGASPLSNAFQQLSNIHNDSSAP